MIVDSDALRVTVAGREQLTRLTRRDRPQNDNFKLADRSFPYMCHFLAPMG